MNPRAQTIVGGSQSGSGVPPLSTLIAAPNGRWSTVKVGDALKLVNGRAFKASEWTKTGTPIVRIQNLNSPDAPYNYYQGDLPAKIALNDGDLLFAWSGTPGTSFGAHIWRGGRAWLNQHIFKVHFDKQQFDKRFLQLAINQNLAEYIRAAHGAAGLAHITKGRFEASELPVPPRPEQRRIVAEIEKQFTRLEAGVAALKCVQAGLKRCRAAILKAACEGKLVPTEAELAGKERRTYETGVQLLARILAERRSKCTGRGNYKEPTTPDANGHIPLPEGWAVASLDQLTSHITSGSRDWSRFYGKGEGIFILAQNIRPMRLDLSELQLVDAPKGDAETERTRVQRDDILVTIVGAKTGDICRVPSDLKNHFVCQSVALIRPVLSGYAKFAELYLASRENGQAQWKRYIYGQGRPHLSFEQLRMTAIPLPPLAEQTRIVAELERRLSVVEELEAVVSANLQRAIRLRQSILQKAFFGSLCLK